MTLYSYHKYVERGQNKKEKKENKLNRKESGSEKKCAPTTDMKIVKQRWVSELGFLRIFGNL